ncbi:MAG: hypothetical protein JOY71_28120 [Acetobacteraceae bacterium]|nr:hypothetical protein [Acetobacteraceae bacterium]MBV8525935.1 hypothetical protein [Acetobacteraceae bacterium]
MSTGKQIELNELIALIGRQEPPSRTIIAIAGAPGSGKSALAESITRKLNNQEAESTAILPMDGFHLDDSVLRQLGSHAGRVRQKPSMSLVCCTR